ncbi:MAG: beta-1,6-N-acetylglucosaminyltransferase [Pseudomonadota bacterium]
MALSGPGFIVLAHERFDRVAELVRYLSLAGPVTVHADRRADARALHDLGKRVEVLSVHATEWGMMGLVDATLDAARNLLSRADVDHVCLVSGSCLPIRPIEEFAEFLSRNPKIDFIESVPVGEASWVKGGLSEERFTLWFPVGWRRRRGLFDALVNLQRRVGVARAVPDDLAPHLGLQWWCLTAETLREILAHPRLDVWRRYFRHVWIPDESFFQTVVRAVSEREIRSQPLTLQRFDADGRPVVFHDDHRQLLRQSSYFFARKIDPDAERLYAHCLSDRACELGDTIWFDPEFKEDRIAAPAKGAVNGALGHLGTSRMVWYTSASRVETGRPYTVLISHDTALMGRIRRSSPLDALRFHGRLFGPFPADLADDFSPIDGLGPGNLPTEPVQRDYRAAQYLAQVLWLGRDRPNAFLFDPGDNRHVRCAVVSDPNARLIVLGDEPVLSELMLPLRTKSGKSLQPPRRLAWYRFVDPETPDVETAVHDILGQDWMSADAWTVPDGAET